MGQTTRSSEDRGPSSPWKEAVLRLLLESPDAQVFWVPFAILRGAVALLTDNVRVIYSTSPPHSSHLAAFVLGTCFRKPYVLDFRDPWEFFPGQLTALMRWLKKLTVFHASRIITVSEGERRELLAEFPALDPRRVAVITNGYDPDDFVSVTALQRQDSKVRLSHVGMIHKGAGREFFDALTIMLREIPDLRDWLSVTLVGGFDPEYQEAVGRLEGAGIVSRAGYVPKATALQYVLSSDVLLILLGGDRFAPSELPAKLSKYLYAGKPIVAVAKRGELWDVLAQSRAGVAVPPGEPDTLARTLARLCADLRAHRQAGGTNQEYIKRFDRRILAKNFADLLNEAVAAV